MLLLESREGLLFRGSEILNPTEVWHYVRKEWVSFNRKHEPVFEGWAIIIDENRAEQLKYANPAAEHYRYYDVPPWLGV